MIQGKEHLLLYAFAIAKAASSTYHCACGTGWLDPDYELNDEQIEWLNGIEDQIGDFLKW